MFYDYALNEVFTYEGLKLKVVEDKTDNCEGCVFNTNGEWCDATDLNCEHCTREDNKTVIFVKV